MTVSSDTDASVTSNLLFEKEVLHAASVLLLPVAIIALVLLYCASGPNRWKHKQSEETRPLKLTPHSKSAVALPVKVEAPPPDATGRERAPPTGVFLGVKPNSNAMRSTGF